MKLNKKTKYAIASLFVILSLFVVSSVVAEDIDEEPVFTVPDANNDLSSNLLVNDDVPINTEYTNPSVDTENNSLFNKGSSNFNKIINDAIKKRSSSVAGGFVLASYDSVTGKTYSESTTYGGKVIVGKVIYGAKIGGKIINDRVIDKDTFREDLEENYKIEYQN
jgi:hypothetical protein